jgi:hypothetical protein
MLLCWRVLSPRLLEVLLQAGLGGRCFGALAFLLKGEPLLLPLRNNSAHYVIQYIAISNIAIESRRMQCKKEIKCAEIKSNPHDHMKETLIE